MTRPTFSLWERPWRIASDEGRAILAQMDVDPSPSDPTVGVFDSPTIAARVVELHNDELERRVAE